jgi:hypothetical protein
MNFSQLAWGAICFYYRSIGDNKYSKIMRDADFLTRLKHEPSSVNAQEFEERVLLDHINIENYDLLLGHGLAKSVLERIVELKPVVSPLLDVTLLDCDLSDSEITTRINTIYARIYSINGLWLTGVSKIVHLLNDSLFPILNLNISRHFGILEGDTNRIQWVKITQQNAKEVVADFNRQKREGSVEKFLSDKLGYSRYGYEKSLVKFLDEFFWLRFGDNLPVPPRWIPPSD